MNRTATWILVLVALIAAAGFWFAGSDQEPPPPATRYDRPLVSSTPPPVTSVAAENPSRPAPQPRAGAEADSGAPSAPDTATAPADPPAAEPEPEQDQEPAPRPSGSAPPGDPDDGAEPVASQLYLTAPPITDPGAPVEFTATWVDADGYGVAGVVELQRAAAGRWLPVARITTETGRGAVTQPVPASAVYRVAFAGDATVAPAASADVAVIAATRMTSTIEVAVDRKRVPAGSSGTVDVRWRNGDGVPVTGELELQGRRAGGGWEPVTSLRTAQDGAASATVTPQASTTYRVAYAGGTRYLPVASDEVAVGVGEVATVAVGRCSSQADVDALPFGVGCHYESVSSGVFVVGHDYRGNAWWNGLDEGAYVELTGRQAGVYEVVDRVIAPGRATALGPAARWSCGDACDVILQTCTGPNTGFTWLRRIP